MSTNQMFKGFLTKNKGAADTEVTDVAVIQPTSTEVPPSPAVGAEANGQHPHPVNEGAGTSPINSPAREEGKPTPPDSENRLSAVSHDNGTPGTGDARRAIEIAGERPISSLAPEPMQSLVFETPVHIDKTPAEFVHLFATLERQVAQATEDHLRTSGILGSEVPYVLGITSAVAGEGKTTVALHLALSAARSTVKKVCLIDFSLGNDEVCRRMGLTALGEGVMDVIEGKSQTITTLKLMGGNDLMVIPAGHIPDNPARAARSSRVTEIMAAVRQNFDVIILDLPAVSTDQAVPLANHTDGLLMIAWSGVTPKRVLSKAIETLGSNKIIGIVLNRYRPSMPNWLQKRFQ